MSGDVVRDLHEHPLVLAGGHGVAEHADQLVDAVALLGEDLGLGEEVLRGLDLAVAPGEAVHAAGHREHEPCPLEDVVIIAHCIFVVVQDVPGGGEAAPAAIVLVPS